MQEGHRLFARGVRFKKAYSKRFAEVGGEV